MIAFIRYINTVGLLRVIKNTQRRFNDKDLYVVMSVDECTNPLDYGSL